MLKVEWIEHPATLLPLKAALSTRPMTMRVDSCLEVSFSYVISKYFAGMANALQITLFIGYFAVLFGNFPNMCDKDCW